MTPKIRSSYPAILMCAPVDKRTALQLHKPRKALTLAEHEREEQRRTRRGQSSAWRTIRAAAADVATAPHMRLLLGDNPPVKWQHDGRCIGATLGLIKIRIWQERGCKFRPTIIMHKATIRSKRTYDDQEVAKRVAIAAAQRQLVKQLAVIP